MKRWQSSYIRAFKGEAYTEEVYGELPDPHWSEISFNPIIESGVVVAVACCSKNISNRKKIEEQLKLSEKMMAEAQRIAKVGSWELGLTKDAGAPIWSDEAYRILGYDPKTDMPSYENYLKRVHPDDLEFSTTIVEKAIAEGSKFSIKHRLILRDGTLRWINSEGEVIVDAVTGMPLKIVGTNQDITDKVLAEEKANRESNNRDILMNTIGDSMWSMDANMNMIAANARFIGFIKAFTGIDIKPGDNLLIEKFGEEVLTRWKARYERALAGETFSEEEYSEYPEPAWTENSFHPIAENGKVVGLACFAKNITTIKIVQEQLKQNEIMMADAQRVAHVGCWERGLEHEDHEKNFVRWSDETFKIFGYDPKNDTASYEKFLNRLHPDDLHFAPQVVCKAIEDKSRYALEHRIILPDGSIRWISSQGEIVVNEETGKPMKVVGTNCDITEKKLMEQEREKIAADLMQRNKDLEQFAYIISHNLRSPVSNIMGLAEELKDDLDTESRTLFLTELSQSVAKLDMVIKDLNYILQIKREITEIKDHVVFSGLVNDIKASISNMIQTEKVTIDVDFSAIDEMYTLKSYLYSVFYNLITNSIKYHQPGIAPHITVKSNQTKNGIALFFSDNGMGIDLEIQGNKVFGLYKRFHTGIEGKGMGLYMTKNQIEALGGTITIDSQVGVGTQFKIEFNK